MTVLMEALGQDNNIDLIRDGKYHIEVDGKPQKWQRVSRITGTLSDDKHLGEWRTHMALRGLAMSGELIECVHAIDPNAQGAWAAMADISERCQDRAGANIGRDLGSAVHAWAERIDRGEPITNAPAALQPWLHCYRQALTDAGLTVEHIEQPVAIEDYKLAGTFDRVLRSADGRKLIGDVKTSKSDSRNGQLPTSSRLAMSIQFAAYALHTNTIDMDDPKEHDGAIYYPLADKVADIDQTEAVMIWIPIRDEAPRCEIFRLALDGDNGGLDNFENAMIVVEARKRAGRTTHRAGPPLMEPYSVPTVGDDTTDRTPQAPPSLVVVPAVSAESTAPALADTAPHGDAPKSKLEELRQRFSALDDAGHKPRLGQVWMEQGTPKISSDIQTDESLAAIDAAIGMVEADVGAPFGAVYVAPPVDHSEMNARIDALPSDLRAKLMGEPFPLIEELELGWRDRISHLTQHLSQVSEETAALILTEVDIGGVAEADDLAAEKIEALVSAVLSGVLSNALTVPPGAEEVLSSKAETLKRGREAAKRHGMPIPSSSSDVSSHVVLRSLTLL